MLVHSFYFLYMFYRPWLCGRPLKNRYPSHAHFSSSDPSECQEMFLKTLQERACRNWHQTELWDGEVIWSVCSAGLRSWCNRPRERRKEITGSTELSLTSMCAPLPTVNKNRKVSSCFPCGGTQGQGKQDIYIPSNCFCMAWFYNLL